MSGRFEIRNLQRKERLDRSLVERAAAAALEAAGLPEGRVSFALVGDRRMTELNRRFKGRRGPTDVLAFPLGEGNDLGEVIISTATCRRQAGERGASFEDELALLVIHGVLHLAGHDHTTDAKSAAAMRATELKVLAALGVRE